MKQVTRLLSVALLAALLSACLVSKAPLITIENAFYPLESGTTLERYKLEGDEFVPSVDPDTQSIVLGELKIESGIYHWRTKEKDPSFNKFLLHRIPGQNQYVIMSYPIDESQVREQFPIDYIYGLLDFSDGFFVVYGFTSNEFIKYQEYSDERDPEAWRQNSVGQWLLIHDGDDVEFASLDFLVQVLPDMIEKGFHLPVHLVYKLPDSQLVQDVEPNLADTIQPSTHAVGTEHLVEECDRLAADRWDPNRTSFGVTLKDLRTKDAINACSAAVEAQPGEPRLQFQLARSFHSAKDYGSALRWYEKAADRGYAAAKFGIGVLHEDGHGVQKDPQTAAAWYRKSAEQGHPLAQTNLGYLYETGIGVIKDHATAVDWWQQAAELGEPVSQRYLGVAYYEGEGVPKNYFYAMYWTQKAAALGDARAQSNLGVMYEQGIGVEQSFKEASTWYQRAADQEDKEGQFALASLYNRGDGVPQDYDRARFYYEKAAEQGHAQAQSDLGLAYFRGNGVPQNYHIAAAWFRKSAAQGNADGQNNLGALYEFGDGVPQSFSKAIELYELAVQQGHELARENLFIIQLKRLRGNNSAGPLNGPGTSFDPNPVSRLSEEGMLMD